MSAPLEPGQGLAVLCGPDGMIQEVLHHALDLGRPIAPRDRIFDVLTTVDTEKVRNFWEALQASPAVLDWQLAAIVNGEAMVLHVVGARVGQGSLVVVARTLDALARVNEELMRINNEQANALRSSVKDLVVQLRGRADEVLYEDLTRVNNDLAALQRELARKNVELERLNEQKDRFVGMAAHDLRSPLGVIITYSDFLETEASAALDPEHQEFVRVIRRTSEFMLALVEDLLDVATIESGQLRLDWQSVDLVELVAHSVALHAVMAAPKGIAIRHETAVSTLTLEADPRKLEQVLTNLIGNAVKFSTRGAEVVVTVGVDGDRAMVAVRDTGPGMEADDLPRLFKPFGRASTASPRGEKSTGLGLAISRRIVEGHGGTIGVESAVGHGSTFTFTVPLSRASPARDASRP